MDIRFDEYIIISNVANCNLQEKKAVKKSKEKRKLGEASIFGGGIKHTLQLHDKHVEDNTNHI